jgi:hypothetical protein
MAKTLRIKRRIAGSSGPPANLLNAELAFNEVAGVLYYGAGSGANAAATSIIAIGGSGAFVSLVGAQTISGAKTFTAAVTLSAGGVAQTPATADNSNAIATTAFVKAQNYAQLVNGVIPSTILPSYVDDVLEFADLGNLPLPGEAGKIYVVLDTNKTYRWSGSFYAEIASSPGSTDSVSEGVFNLYFTPGRAALAAPVQSVAGRTGAVILEKADVGLGQVDNVSDINKPISIATQTALNSKAEIDHGHPISEIANLQPTLAAKLTADSLIDGGSF